MNGTQKNEIIRHNGDWALLLHAKQGDVDALEKLINKNRRIVYMEARHFFSLSGDSDDIIQEGLIGLYKAIHDYDKNENTSFLSFARLCIERQIITYIKLENRLKHTALTSSLSIYKHVGQVDSGTMLIDIVENSESTEPYCSLEIKDFLNQVEKMLMEKLTSLEWGVFCLYINGYSYKEMSQKLKKGTKTIDNAMQRIRRKSVHLREKFNNIIDLDTS